MKKLILLSGSPCVGKTTVGQYLFEQYSNSAYLDGDWCWCVNPFSVEDKRLRNGDKSMSFVLSNYLQSEFEYVFFTSVVLTDCEIRENILKDITADDYEVLSGAMKLYTAIGLITVAVLCFAVWFAGKIVRNILSPMKQGRPFEADIPSQLRKIAWLNLICGALLQIFSSVERLLLVRAYQMEQIFSSPAVESAISSESLDSFNLNRDFPGGPVVNNPPANAGNTA